jgi:hypothetical protein
MNGYMARAMLISHCLTSISVREKGCKKSLTSSISNERDEVLNAKSLAALTIMSEMSRGRIILDETVVGISIKA